MTTSKPTLPQAETSLPRVTATEQAGHLLLLFGLASLAGIWRWWRSQRPAWLVLPILGQLATVLLAWMFRSPERHAVSDGRVVLAPADGHVTRVDQVQEARFGPGPCWRITTRSAWHDVQVHRAPVAGAVSLRRYEVQPSRPGEQHACWIGIAALDDANDANAQPAANAFILVHFVTSTAWRLVPGYAARRLYAWADLGEEVRAGQEIGLMPLGGLVETFVPVAASIRIRAGQTVRAGETVVAMLPAAHGAAPQ